MRKFITGNMAVAEAVRLCRTQIVAAYPITPQTPIYEKLSDWEAAGELGGIMMRTESEHSAMAACLSASLTGARTFTATSSQGLALMHEMLHFAAGCRAPVVMVNVNRTLAAPWAFWSDQTDSLSQRDTGWMQVYCENNQEALDSVIQAYRIAEKVLLPCMVVTEANFISHFMEPVEVPEPELVHRFVPPVAIPRRFDVDNPGFVVPVVSPVQYREYRRLAQEAMEVCAHGLRGGGPGIQGAVRPRLRLARGRWGRGCGARAGDERHDHLHREGGPRPPAGARQTDRAPEDPRSSGRFRRSRSGRRSHACRGSRSSSGTSPWEGRGSSAPK